jgi:predicted esterase
MTFRLAPRSTWAPYIIGALLATLASPAPLLAAGVVLKNGTELEGEVGDCTTMVPALKPASNGGVEIRYTVNDITRTYFAFNQLRQVLDHASPPDVKIHVNNIPAKGGNQVKALGAYKIVEPLNDVGHRTIRIGLAEGPADIVQGVTLITSRYYLFKTMPAGRMLLLEQPYPLSTLTGDQLLTLLRFAVRNQKPEVRKNVVRLLLQAGRYVEASKELKELSTAFPQMEDLPELLRELRQASANTAIRELRRLQDAGQPATVRKALAAFPKEGIDGEILLQVREMITQDLEVQQQLESLKTELKQRVEKLAEPAIRKQFTPIIDEICGELTRANLPRLSAYRRLAADPDMNDSDKLALAISGWLLGSDDAMPNLPRAQSLIAVRGYIRDYLGEPLKANRDALLGTIRSQEGASPQLVAKLLAAMKPIGTLPEVSDKIPGYYELTVPGRDKEPDTAYRVQLPPEYDPYRRYPVVVTLHGQSTNPVQQIDWWCGSFDEKKGVRTGQATRHGYIIVAPQWANEGQRKYEYSRAEHTAVLNALRDACRRFSVDTDRVYLSGYAMGGDAAWDMGLAHPDLWAGVVPITATADSNRYNYCQLYWKNAQSVPLYFVGGEYDATKRAKNGSYFDRYFFSSKCDTMVVEYLGRGHEGYSDEIVKIFDWMGRHQRNFFPKKFECSTLRSYDNFFWWVEINKFLPNITVDPEQWPVKGARTLAVIGNIVTAGNLTTVSVVTGKSTTTVWLSPELVDFKQRIHVVLKGRPEVTKVSPEVSVILDDARTRGDRQHPFWVRVDFP